MILNATLHRVDAPATPTPDGTPAWTNGLQTATRCALVAPGRTLLTSAEASKVTVTAALYVTRTAGGPVFTPGQRVTVWLDGDAAPVLYFVRLVVPVVKAGGLSNWQLGLEAA